MKHPNGEPIGANGYIAAGYYGDPQHQQMHQQQHHQQQQQQYQQQQQPYNPQQQMEDYTHYPHPEEYMSERNRAAYFANGDQYAMPSKPRQRLESDCKFLFKCFLSYYFFIKKIFSSKETKFLPSPFKLSLQPFIYRFPIRRRVWASRPLHWSRHLRRAAPAEHRHARARA